jgi:hypothetical protein
MTVARAVLDPIVKLLSYCLTVGAISGRDSLSPTIQTRL